MGHSEVSLAVLSTKEAESYAESINMELGRVFETKHWRDLFKPGAHNLQNLEQIANAHHFFVVVLTPDDKTASRGSESPSPRDNLIFELGLLMGRRGPKRTFVILVQGDEPVKIPTDLAGICFIEILLPPTKEQLLAACKKIVAAVAELEDHPEVYLEGVRTDAQMVDIDEVYRRAKILVQNARYRVDATSFGPGGFDWSPPKEEYLATLAKRASEQRKKGFTVRVLYPPLHLDNCPRRSNLRRRREAFLTAGAVDTLDVRSTNRDWGVDLLIVDRRHLHISFQDVRGTRLLHGLEFRNARDLVERFSYLFDAIFDQAEKVEIP